MEKPLVTVSLVVFNQENYLREAIESCLMQKVNFSYEIIIHDDKSSDNSANIIMDYANKYPDVIVPILQTENQFSQGTEIISKFIIPKAKGKYVAFLEGDDYWNDPMKLQFQVDFMESHFDVAMCFTATKKIHASNPDKPKIRRYKRHHSVVPHQDVILIGGSLLDMGAVVARKSVFNDIPKWYYYSQMWDNTVPLLSMLHGHIFFLNRVTCVYRENTPGSYTQKNVRAIEKRKAHILKTIHLLEEFNKGTNNKYNNFVDRKIKVISNGLLLLLDPKDENFDKYYSNLTPGLKLEFKLFNLIGNYTLWKKYRYFLSYFRKIKYV
jgi:glycosyltransferase involved in cell wall biosynthesis